jgi:hypothetical protein
MAKLTPCPSCGSFLPLNASACAHCDRGLIARMPLPLKGLMAVGAGGLLSMTLSACYGVVVDPYDSGIPSDGGTCDDITLDLDGDGYCGDLDCNENEADTNAGADDPLGDSIDQNCDGVDGIAP